MVSTRRSACGAVALIIALLVIGTPRTASAATINVIYDESLPEAVDPCSDEQYENEEGETIQGPLLACEGGVDRTPDLTLIVEAAAAFYADVFEDAHEVTIRFGWLEPFDPLPEGGVLERDDDERPTEGYMLFPSNVNLFYDPTPDVDEEVEMRPRLYRTTHPVEQGEAFEGSVPEVLEVSYVGRYSGSPDLVSWVLHEMGHALGLSGGPIVGPGPACHGEDDPFFRPDAAMTGGSAIGIAAYVTDKPSQQCVHVALGGIQACKTDPAHKVGDDPDVESTLPEDLPPEARLTLWECASHQALNWVSEFPLARTRPGIVDLLVVAEAGGWQELDLPRKYTAEPGAWGQASTWIGNRVPDAFDDVYIVNQSADAPKIWTTPAAGASVANLYISERNALQVQEGLPLLISEDLTIAGPNTQTGPLRFAEDDEPGDGDEVAGSMLTQVEVSPNATLDAFQGMIESGGVLRMLASSSTSSTALIGELRNFGVIVGAGEIRTSDLVNARRIRAFGGTLVIGTPESDPEDDLTTGPAVLDLDGSPESFSAELLATEGDLVFDGIIADPVRATVFVGEERSLAFTSGWHQEFAGLLVLDGPAAPASVIGDSRIDGTIQVNGHGMFEDDVQMASFSFVQVSIAGTEAVTEHDQLSVGGLAEIGGTLVLELAEGYQPAPLDEFVLMTYGARSGEFGQILNSELPGGLALLPDYQDKQLVLSVGFDGASPEEPNCKGKAVSTQASIHGSLEAAAEFHGYSSVNELQQAIKAFCTG